MSEKIPSTIQIEKLPNGGVVVRVARPPVSRGQAVGMWIVASVAICGVPLAGWWIFSDVANTALSRIPFILMAVGGFVIAFAKSRSFSQSYVLTADASGITIERSRGEKKSQQHLPRQTINDIRLGFRQSHGHGSFMASNAWLIIATNPWHRRNILILDQLGGDELAKIADALRAATGMPKRSWP